MDENPSRLNMMFAAFLKRWKPRDEDQRHGLSEYEFEADLFGLARAIHSDAAAPFEKILTASLAAVPFPMMPAADRTSPRQWKTMESAPRDGTVIEACARLPTAGSGFPQFISWTDDAWYTSSYTRHQVEPWCWRPRQDGWPQPGHAFPVEGRVHG